MGALLLVGSSGSTAHNPANAAAGGARRNASYLWTRPLVLLDVELNSSSSIDSYVEIDSIA